MSRLEAAESQFYLDTLRELVSIPTASFHEEHLMAYVTAFLRRYDLPYQVDDYGNVIAHYQHGPTSRPLALMAHTDHPAFELEGFQSDPSFPEANWTARLLGGVGLDWFGQSAPIKVFVANDPARPVAGRLLWAELLPGPRAVRLFLKLDEAEGLAGGQFGIWDILDFEQRGDMLHARVMDDLVGCAATLLTLWKMMQQGADTNLYGVFTRAEEVGLVGAGLVFQHKLLPPETYVVSLEASRALPGAVPGEGPVIRVGDRAFTFSEEAEFVLKKAASNLLTWPEPLKTQRQLMSGGRCEAGTAILQGYTATGLAFPLGNYHNMAEDKSLAAETIHQQDFLTGVQLLQEAARLMPVLPQLQAAQLAAETTSPALIERLSQTRGKYK